MFKLAFGRSNGNGNTSTTRFSGSTRTMVFNPPSETWSSAPAPRQMDYMVDMAKADALELLGEDRKAVELVERHV